MSKKKLFDFSIGFLGVAVSHLDAYKSSQVDIKEKKALREKEKEFREILQNITRQEIEGAGLGNQFPTAKPVCLFILQYFSSEKDYNRRDLDNIAKSILDSFKGVVFKSDAQVKTLLISKKLKDERVDKNFLFVAGKEHNQGYERFVKEAGIERVYNAFQEIKKVQE